MKQSIIYTYIYIYIMLLLLHCIFVKILNLNIYYLGEKISYVSQQIKTDVNHYKHHLDCTTTTKNKYIVLHNIYNIICLTEL